MLRSVPASLQETVQANVSAGTELRALGKPRTSLPPWRIVAPAPAPELLGHYKAAEASLGIPWQYLAAIHLVETRMGRIRGTSVAGAQGPMQFLPATWSRYGKGGDINSNRDAIFGAARLLAANGGPGNMSNALYRYNPTPRYVKAVTAYAGQMQDNEARLLRLLPLAGLLPDGGRRPIAPRRLRQLARRPGPNRSDWSQRPVWGRRQFDQNGVARAHLPRPAPLP